MGTKRKFGVKGVWLPGEVAFNNELNERDKHVWWIIDSLDCSANNCWASNEYIAYLLETGPTTISGSIKKLKEKGYIKQISFDGRVRRLKRNDSYLRKYRYLVEKYNDRVEKLNFDLKEGTRTNFDKKDNLNDINDYSEDVQQLFKFWQSLEIVVHKKSKTRNKILQKLNIKVQHYSLREIKDAMQTYKNLLVNPCSNLKIRPPYKVGLDEFFGFEPFTRSNIKKYHKNLRDVRSWFAECLKGSEYLEKYISKTKDKDPNLTKYIIKDIQRFTKGQKLGLDQVNMCRKASNVIYDLWRNKYKNKKNIGYQARSYVAPFYKGWILPWMEDKANCNYKTFGIHWLLTKIFVNEIDEYIKKNAYNSVSNDLNL